MRRRPELLEGAESERRRPTALAKFVTIFRRRHNRGGGLFNPAPAMQSDLGARNR